LSMLMVAHCPKCGQVYQKNIRNMCKDCTAAHDNLLNACHSYLRDHRKATNEELIEATGITEAQLTAFIKESRLPLYSHPNLTYACSSCGGRIRQHQLCANCRARITEDIQRMNEREAKQRANVFHYRDR
jgi:ribosomal protein L32